MLIKTGFHYSDTRISKKQGMNFIGFQRQKKEFSFWICFCAPLGLKYCALLVLMSHTSLHFFVLSFSQLNCAYGSIRPLKLYIQTMDILFFLYTTFAKINIWLLYLLPHFTRWTCSRTRLRTALRQPLLLYIACMHVVWQLLKFGISVNSIYYYIPYSTMLLLIVHNQSSFCVSYPNSLAWRHCHCIILRNIIWSSQGYKIS